MASPTTTISRVEYSVGFQEFDLAASRRGFIAPSVLRPLPMGKQSASIGHVPLAELLADGGTDIRAPGSGYSRLAFRFGTVSYECQEHGAESPMDDSEIAKFRDVLDAEAIHAQRAIDRVLRNLEITVAAALYNGTTFTEENGLQTALEAAWDAEGGTPVANIRAAMRAVWARIGAYPNVLVLNRHQLDVLADNEELLDRVRYTGGSDAPAIVTPQAIAAVCGLDRVVVADSAKNTANEAQDPTIAEIWSDNYAMVCRVATGDDVSEPCIGRLFQWSEEAATAFDGSEIALLTEEYRQDAVRGSVFRARTNYDAKLLLPAAAQLLSGVLSS